jgi:hypothetical protein
LSSLIIHQSKQNKQDNNCVIVMAGHVNLK